MGGTLTRKKHRHTIADEVLKDALERFRESDSASQVNRNDAEEEVCFPRLGEQWPEAIKKQREAEGRPILTINKPSEAADDEVDWGGVAAAHCVIARLPRRKAVRIRFVCWRNLLGKNPQSHRDHPLRAQEAAQPILFASDLIDIVDSRHIFTLVGAYYRHLLSMRRIGTEIRYCAARQAKEHNYGWGGYSE